MNTNNAKIRAAKSFIVQATAFSLTGPQRTLLKGEKIQKNKSTAVAQNEKSVRNRKNNNTVVVSVKVQERRNDGS